MDDESKSSETLLTFPCNFTIKIFGLATDEFETEVLRIIQKHVPNSSDHTIQSRPSKQGKYAALSVTVFVESKAQLDAIYQDLSSSPKIIMAL